jgi:hypothetical protein
MFTIALCALCFSLGVLNKILNIIFANSSHINRVAIYLTMYTFSLYNVKVTCVLLVFLR